MSEGWIKIHRKIFDNRLWFKEPFDEAHAWIDLLLLANHKDGWLKIRGNQIPIKRGQIGWSKERLAARWFWSRGKVNRFLTWLKTVHQIEQQKSTIISLITIVNYEEYQKNGTSDGTTDGHQTVQQTDTNKNVKKEKNVKKRVGVAFAPPSPEDVKTYCLERGNTVDHEQFINFYTSKGWVVGKTKMKDWRAAVRTWEKRNTPAGPQKSENTERRKTLEEEHFKKYGVYPLS